MRKKFDNKLTNSPYVSIAPMWYNHRYFSCKEVRCLS